MEMIRRIAAVALAAALLAGPAAAQTSVIIRKPDNSGAVDPANAANQVSGITQATAVNTVLGLQADPAWSGSGAGSLISISKYLAAKLEATRALLAGTLTVQFPSAQAVTQSGAWNVTNISGTVSLPTGAATSANQGSANTKLDQLHTDMLAPTPAGTAIIGKVGIDQTTPGTTNAVSPQYGASGVTPVTGVLVSNTKTAAFPPIGGRPFYLELTGTGSTVVEVQYLLNDGSTYAAEVVATDGGSPTVLNSISYSGGTRNGVRIPLEVGQSGMSVKASPGTVTGTVNFAFVQ